MIPLLMLLLIRKADDKGSLLWGTTCTHSHMHKCPHTIQKMHKYRERGRLFFHLPYKCPHLFLCAAVKASL